MCSGCNKISVWYWALMQSSSYKSGDVSHIDHKVCSYFISNLTEFSEIDFAWVGARTGNDQLRLVSECFFTNILIVDAVSCFVDTILYEIILNATEVNWATVC